MCAIHTYTMCANIECQKFSACMYKIYMVCSYIHRQVHATVYTDETFDTVI